MLTTCNADSCQSNAAPPSQGYAMGAIDSIEKRANADAVLLESVQRGFSQDGRQEEPYTRRYSARLLDQISNMPEEHDDSEVGRLRGIAVGLRLEMHSLRPYIVIMSVYGN